LAFVILLLAAVAVGLPGFIEGSRKGLLTGIHDSCVNSAAETARGRGVDAAQPDIAQKIENYCSCVAGSVESGQVTTSELSTFSADPQSTDPAVTKVRTVVASCLH
jgi:hypothetical protein